MEQQQQTTAIIDPIISKWLQARQALTATLEVMCALRPYESNNLPALDEALIAFCQHLMDYISLGHFEILEKIETVVASSAIGEQRLPSTLLQMLTQTTIKALDFNDQFPCASAIKNLHRFDQSLSQLALSLADRFEVEDAFIRLYQQAKIHRFAKTA